MVLLLFPWSTIMADIAIPQTGVTAGDSIVTGDDGNIRAGIPHPIPRFIDNGDGTVTDNLTDLVWLKNANCLVTPQTWSDAITWANGLSDSTCGLAVGATGVGSWRMPNIRELVSLINFRYAFKALSNTAGSGQWSNGDPFTNVQVFYWSSTSSIDGGVIGVNAHSVNIDKGITLGFSKTNPVNDADPPQPVDLFVWPVRSLTN